MTSRRSTRRELLKLTGAGSVVALAGCSDEGELVDEEGDDSAPGGTDDSGTDDGDDRSGGRLVYSQQVAPIALDPLDIGDIYSYQIAYRVFDQLYELDEETNMIPKVAASDPIIERDGERFIIELVEDAMFHDGEPLTAEDVEYTLMAPVEQDEIGDDTMEFIESTDIIDDHTLQIDLEIPYAPFQIEALTNSVVSKEAREADREAYNTEMPIGSGPYRFVDWTQDEFVHLERWDDYWDDPLPHVEEIEFVPVEEPTTRVTRLQTGESDAIDGIPPQIWDTVQEMDDVEVHEQPGINYFFVALNCNQGPTADPRVREAIDYCFSMDQAVENFVEPAGLRNPSMVPLPVAESWDMPVDQWADIPHDVDIDEARRLFEEAGVPEDYEFRLLSPPDDIRENILVSVANGIQEAGWDTQVERLDWGAFLDQIESGDDDDYNLYALGYLPGPDPDLFLYDMIHEDTAGDSPNGVFYENDDVMSKLTQARESPDFDERRELYIDVITTLLEDRVHFAGYSPTTTVASKDHVRDMAVHSRPRINPRMVSPFNNVWLDE